MKASLITSELGRVDCKQSVKGKGAKAETRIVLYTQDLDVVGLQLLDARRWCPAQPEEVLQTAIYESDSDPPTCPFHMAVALVFLSFPSCQQVGGASPIRNFQTTVLPVSLVLSQS